MLRLLRSLITACACALLITTAYAGVVELRDEGVSKGYVAVVDVVGPNVAATRSGIVGTITEGGGAGVYLRLDQSNRFTDTDSCYLGYNTGLSDVGANNTFLGASAGNSNTSGAGNTYIGRWAGYAMTDDSDNVIIGYNAGYNATDGDYCTIIGSNAGANNQGDYNTFIGQGAGNACGTGHTNTCVGFDSGGDLTTGEVNTCLGSGSGASLQDGSYNTFIGQQTGRSVVSGTTNTYVGQSAGYLSTASSCTFLGQASGRYHVTGNQNTAVGSNSMWKDTDGIGNTVVGQGALYENLVGDYNVAIGVNSGLNSVGNNNIFLGTQAGQSETGNYKLYIDSTGATVPLIYGDFLSQYLSLSGGGGDAAQTLLNLVNTDPTSASETSQTADLVFKFNGSVNESTYATAEAAKISAYKVNDWFALNSDDHDSGLKFYTTSAGTSTVRLTISHLGGATFTGALLTTLLSTGPGYMELGDAAVANGDTDSIPTGDQVYDFVVGGWVAGAGAFDFGGATSVEIPNGTSGTTDAAGEIYLDTNGDNSTVIDGVIQVYSAANQYFFGTAGYPSADNDVMAYDSATNKVTWQAQAGGAGGGATYREMTLLPESCVLDDGSPPAISIVESTGTGTPRYRVADFDATTDEIIYYSFVLPSDYTASSSPIVDVYWFSNDVGANETCVWGIQVSATTEADADSMIECAMDADILYISEDVDVNEANRLMVTSGTLTYATYMDGAAAGDMVTIAIRRDADSTGATDDLTSDARLVAVHVKIPRS